MELRKSIHMVDKNGAPIEVRHWDLGAVYQKYEGQPNTYITLFQVNGVFKASVVSDLPADANVAQLRMVEDALCLESFGIDPPSYLAALSIS